MRRIFTWVLVFAIVFSGGCVAVEAAETDSARPTVSESSDAYVLDREQVAGREIVVFHDPERGAVCYLYEDINVGGMDARSGVGMSCVPESSVTVD